MSFTRSRLHRRIGAAVVALFSLLGMATPAIASPARDTLPTRYVLPGDRTFPEGIARASDTPYFYVGSTTNGTIFRGDIRNPQTSVFLPGGQDGRTSAIGMKVDPAGRLIIVGGITGKVWVYDTNSGALLHVFTTTVFGPFLNDLAVADNGDVYITDSLQPNLYRITAAELASAETDQPLQTYLDLSPYMHYQRGVNANGIVVTPDQQHLVVAHYNVQLLYLIDLAQQVAQPIDLGGELVSGDGLLLRDGILYAVSGPDFPALISIVELSADYLSGTVLQRWRDSALRGPSTAAFDGDDLLVVNFQAGATHPALPFDIVRLTPHLPSATQARAGAATT